MTHDATTAAMFILMEQVTAVGPYDRNRELRQALSPVVESSRFSRLASSPPWERHPPLIRR
jgi:hypothetical protein